MSQVSETSCVLNIPFTMDSVQVGWEAGWAGPSAALDTMVKRKISAPTWNRILILCNKAHNLII